MATETETARTKPCLNIVSTRTARPSLDIFGALKNVSITWKIKKAIPEYNIRSKTVNLAYRENRYNYFARATEITKNNMTYLKMQI